jgi:hypothetical protein
VFLQRRATKRAIKVYTVDRLVTLIEKQRITPHSLRMRIRLALVAKAVPVYFCRLARVRRVADVT